MQNLTERFHFIDLRPAGELMPAENHVFLQSFRDHHPDAEIVLWTYGKLLEEGHAVPAQFYAEKSPVGQSDILRVWVLANFGGIYCDSDVICLAPWTDWTAGKAAFIAQFAEQRVGITVSIMGGVAGSALFTSYLAIQPGVAMIYKNAPEYYGPRTGSPLMQQVLAQDDYGPDSPHPVTLAAPSLFCPYKMSQALAGEVPNLSALREGGALSVHLWATSSGTKAATYRTVVQRMMNALGYSHLRVGQPLEALPPRQGGETS